MKFTIGTVSGSLDLTEDLRLIRSAILYADEVELIGLVEYALYRYLPSVFQSYNNLNEVLLVFEKFFSSLGTPESAEYLKEILDLKEQCKLIDPILKKRKKRTKEELIAQIKLNSVNKEIINVVQNELNKIYLTPATNEIKELVDNRIVSVFNYDECSFRSNELAGGYFANLMKAICSGNEYPLFDKLSNDIVNSIASLNILDVSKINSRVLRHAGVASNILMTLPTLEATSIDELIDLKKDNQEPLVHFRNAIYDFSSKIESLPWDENFKYDCLQLYHAEVAPRVAEINEVLTQTSTLRNLGSRALADEEIRRKAGYTVAGLSVVISTQSDLYSAFEAMKSLMVLGGFAGLTMEATTGFLKIASLFNQSRNETRETIHEAKKNVMYYYYLASKL